MSSDSSDSNENAVVLFNGFPENPECTTCTVKPPAISRCETCENYLCFQCDEAHKLMVCFQTHKIFPLNKPKTCLKHEGKDITHRCFTCCSYICSQCLNSEHLYHDCHESDFQWKATFEQFYTQGKKCIETLLEVDDELQQYLDNLRRYKSNSAASINQVHAEYQEILNMQRNKMLQDLEKHYNTRENLIISKRLEIEESVNQFINKVNVLKGGMNGFIDMNSLMRFNGLNHVSTTESSENAENGFDLMTEAFPALNYNINQILDDDTEEPTTSNATPVPISLPNDTKHVNSVQIYKIFGQKGNASGQFNSPHGFCLGFDEDIVVADSSNHRIQIFDNQGNFKFHFGFTGRHDGYLWYPRRVAILPKKRQYVVCDRGYERSRMQIFTKDGLYVRKIYIQYIDIVSGLAVTEDENIIVVDSVTPTLFVIGQNEYLRSIDCSDFMEEPSDIAVLGKEFYICDFKAHNICVVNEEGNLLRKFGCKNTTTFPNGIDITMNGEVIVGDSHGNFFHISVYSKTGDFLIQFRCPYMKVSRCCGLKVTTKGHIVTVDKNYHHMIMLDAAYLTGNNK